MEHTNEIAIKILKKQYNDYPENAWHYDDQYLMICEGIIQSNRLKEASVTSPSLNEKVLRAVDVTQRLPEKDERNERYSKHVYLQYSKGYNSEGYYDFQSKEWLWSTAEECKPIPNVTHWYEEISLSVGEEAVSFAEWLTENYIISTQLNGEQRFVSYKEFNLPIDKWNQKTTQELYQIFLKREGK